MSFLDKITPNCEASTVTVLYYGVLIVYSWVLMVALCVLSEYSRHVSIGL